MRTEEIYELNKQAISNTNAYLLKRVSFVAFINMTLLSLISPFLSGFQTAEFLYIACAILTGAFALICHFFMNKIEKVSTALFYILLASILAYGTVLSDFIYKDMSGVTIVALFLFIPMVVLDKNARANLIFFIYYLIYIIITITYKSPKFIFDDCLICGCFLLFGVLIGNYLRSVRLESINQKRLLEEQQILLEEQRSVDPLTGLNNRRNLFETLDAEGLKVTGLMMMDVDNFKEYNDTKGHVEGDNCLQTLGTFLTSFSESLKLHFFRYGGDEFIALYYGKSCNELALFGSTIVNATNYLSIQGIRITLSLGAAFRGDNSSISYEKMIASADKALYQAKQKGRNRSETVNLN